MRHHLPNQRVPDSCRIGSPWPDTPVIVGPGVNSHARKELHYPLIWELAQQRHGEPDIAVEPLRHCPWRLGMGEVTLSTAGNGQLAATPVGSLQDRHAEAQPAGGNCARQARGPAANDDQVCNLNHYMNLTIFPKPSPLPNLPENLIEPFCV
jgi:hypothetical protein